MELVPDRLKHEETKFVVVILQSSAAPKLKKHT